MNLFGEEEKTAASAYRVLARKYRPTVFDNLIGQEVLVRTLSNAITSGRLAHAFLLTGIRGVGKTTTARLIARALNCIGEDGKSGPTISPCGVCAHCRMIAEDRHMDVIEMDAASRTGVDAMRDLIDTVHYAPASGRYKIYIIDEVHMLSTSAFNALLKTLEEPPPHVKFIFATTELRKIPVTILSRCQTFELKRIDEEVLTQHLANIAGKEGVAVEREALQLIAGAAEGSVRDSLSLLDQAIAQGTDASGAAQVTPDLVRSMLGVADRSRTFALFEQMMAGQAQAVLSSFDALYHDGAEPAQLVQELLELTHFVTRIKLLPELANNPTFAQSEREQAASLASRLGMAELSRVWQMLVKASQEVRAAPQPKLAAEMALVRIVHAASLPNPAELIQSLQHAAKDGLSSPASAREEVAPRAAAPKFERATGAAAPVATPSVAAIAKPSAGTGASGRVATAIAPAAQLAEPVYETGFDVDFAPESAVMAEPEMIPVDDADEGEEERAVVQHAPAHVHPENFRAVVNLFRERREIYLYSYLYKQVHLVSFEPGCIELRPQANVPADFAGRVKQLLQVWTGQSWGMIISAKAGSPTLAEQDAQAEQARIEEVKELPQVQAVLAQFGNAQVRGVRRSEPTLMNKENSEV